MEKQVRGAPKTAGSGSHGADAKIRTALNLLNEVRTELARKLADYVIANGRRIKDETSGEDSYGFALHQMDELFLIKLNIIERAMAELARLDVRETSTTYECIEVSAKREELPQRVADALAERGDSALLGIAVLAASAEKADLLLVTNREERPQQ
ncbi:MAG: hypothetical protein N3A38_10100 [Planctomycetota bacterium]|nr:hypothetical protein [Planctomycetota bacterium]